MIFVLFVFCYLITIQFIANYTETRSHKIFSYIVVILSFILLQCLRVYCQQYFPDIPNYQSVFETIQPISFVIEHGYGLDDYNSNFEIGFRILNSISKWIIDDYGFFLFIISIFELVVLWIFCKKYEINFINTFLIYFCLTYVTFQIGILRQALAFCFFLLALVSYRLKIVYIGLILLGSLFHVSILPFLCFFKIEISINRKFINLAFLTSVIVYLLQIDIIQQIFFMLGFGYIFETGKVGYYIDVNLQNSFLGIGFWDRFSLFVIMNIIYTYYVKNNKITAYTNIIYNLGTSVIILQMFFFSSPMITSRLRYYIVLFPLIFISEFIYTQYEHRNKYIYQVVFSLYLLLYLYFQATYLRLV